MKKVTLELWHQFTPQELDSKAQEMSMAMLSYDETEERKKAASSQFTDTMKALRGTMRILSKQIRSRGCESPVECAVYFHKPRIAMKQIVRLDTGEIVREEAMTPEECQENLFTDPRDIDELNKLYNANPEPPRPEAA